MRKHTPFITFVAILLTVFAAPVSAVLTDDTRPSTYNQYQSAQGTSSYIIIMDALPVLAYEGNLAGLSDTKPARGQKVNPNSADVLKYTRYLQAEHAAAAAAVGITQSDIKNSYAYALNGFSAIMTQDQAKELANQKGVRKVMPDEMQYPQTDNSPTFLGLNASAGPWAKGYDGEGVVIGVIDTGIWPEHPSFADDGSYPAPPVSLAECDFGNTAHNPMDAPYTCNNKLIGARQMLSTYRSTIGATPSEYDSARDDDGHGSHTASTSGGNADVQASIFGIDRGTVSGIAPRAHIVAYKGLGDLGGFTSDLTAAIDQAVADGVDVINYSIGGGASLTSATDIAFLFAADAGVFAATSAGNSGPGSETIGRPGNAPWITTVGGSKQNRTFQGSVVSGDSSEYFGASVTDGVGPVTLVDAADLGNELCYPATPFSASVSGKIVLCKRGNIARVDKSLAVLNAGGSGMILYNTYDYQDLMTDNHFVPSLHINNTFGLAVKAYIASAGSGATATINGGVFTEIPAPWMAAFSSRGPNSVAPDLIKPDVTAPGVSILAGNSPTPDNGAPGELFQATSGTSMSSPHVAGVFALLKQAHPDWSAAMAKSALMTTAYQDVKKEDGATPADPFDMGAGHINPGGKVSSETAFEPGLVYDAGLDEYAAFTCGADLGIFTPGNCDLLASLGVPMDASDLNLPSIGIAELSGSQTVVRTVTSVAKEKKSFLVFGRHSPGSNVTVIPSSTARTFQVSVDAPPGFSVEVTPSVFSLKKGQTATYQVTITNVSALIDEWAFGSLTWADGDYSVYSPIAVRSSP